MPAFHLHLGQKQTANRQLAVIEIQCKSMVICHTGVENAPHRQRNTHRYKVPDWRPLVRCSGCSGFPPYKTKGNRNEKLLQRCTSSIFCKCIKYMYLIRVGQKRNETISESESESEPKACDRLLARQHFVSLFLVQLHCKTCQTQTQSIRISIKFIEKKNNKRKKRNKNENYKKHE